MSLLYDNDSALAQVAQQLQKTWENKLGIKVQLKGVERNEMKARLSSGEFVLALMEIAAGSSSPEVRDAYLKDAEQLLLENSNIIPLYSRTMPYVIRDKVLGAVSDGLGGWYFGAVNRAS